MWLAELSKTPASAPRLRTAFDLAARDRLPDDSELVPYWIYPPGDAKVERMCLFFRSVVSWSSWDDFATGSPATGLLLRRPARRT